MRCGDGTAISGTQRNVMARAISLRTRAVMTRWVYDFCASPRACPRAIVATLAC
jgi:hypothetical protein